MATQPVTAANFSIMGVAVARDLEALLNTRCVDTEGDLEAYAQANQSVLSFGIIDLSSLSLLNPVARVLVLDLIRSAISYHEPRLSEVAVRLEEA